jgi:hypothetical protein
MLYFFSDLEDERKAWRRSGNERTGGNILFFSVLRDGRIAWRRDGNVMTDGNILFFRFEERTDSVAVGRK